MGSNDEFGPDTETIRAWLNKRATYARDARVIGAPRGASLGGDPSPPAPSTRSSDVTPHTTPDQPDLPERPTSADSPDSPDGVEVSRSVLAALGIDAPDASEAPPPADHRRSGDAARSVVETVRGEPAARTEPVPKATPPAGRAPARTPADPARQAEPTVVRSGRWTEPEENLTVTEATTDVEFPVRAGPRRVLSVVLLAALVATGLASYVLWREPTTTTLGLAAITGVLTLVAWAVRASAAPTRLSIRRGQLSITRGGRTEMVDVRSPYTPVAIVGEPGHRNWRVLIERPGMPLVEITPAMVDSHWFTSALFRLRPELRPRAEAEADEDDAEDLSRER